MLAVPALNGTIITLNINQGIFLYANSALRMSARHNYYSQALAGGRTYELNKLKIMLKIRLARIGKKKKPMYRIIISESARDTYGKFLEKVI